MARGNMVGVKLGALLLVVLALVPYTMQLRATHPQYELVQSLNEKEGPFLAIITSTTKDQRLLGESGFFKANPTSPLTIAGRRFMVGKFIDVPAVVARAGSPLAGVASTVQVLADTFDLKGVISYGSAGGISDDVSVTDVVVPSLVGYTGVWKWESSAMPKSSKDESIVATLTFGDFNYPKAGFNYLGQVKYSAVQLYVPKPTKKQVVWFRVNAHWLKVAGTIHKTDIGLGGEGSVVHGMKGASSDVYLTNPAYAHFVHHNLNATIVDTESAAVVQTALANGLPHIVFRGVSNKPGLGRDTESVAITSENVFKTVVEFVRKISNTTLTDPIICLAPICDGSG